MRQSLPLSPVPSAPSATRTTHLGRHAPGAVGHAAAATAAAAAQQPRLRVHGRRRQPRANAEVGVAVTQVTAEGPPAEPAIEPLLLREAPVSRGKPCRKPLRAAAGESPRSAFMRRGAAGEPEACAQVGLSRLLQYGQRPRQKGHEPVCRCPLQGHD
eukprot:360262-Chlamydomonas_euryale.AAC.7